jgi:hypothetical protein
MTFSRRGRKYLGYSGLFVLVLFFVIFYYQLSTYYPFNPFFPPSGKTTYFMELTYPPVTNGKVQEMLLNASFNIESNETLAEGVKVTITNPRIKLYGGTPRNEYIIHNISAINIAFQNAQPMGGSGTLIIPLDNISQTQNINYNFPPGMSFQMDENDKNHPIFSGVHNYELNLSHGYIPEVIQNKPFSFAASGDYSPSIILEFSNDSSPISYTYEEIKFHVPSVSELRTQELNQIGGFIAVVLLIFSFFEALKLINEWIKGAP